VAISANGADSVDMSRILKPVGKLNVQTPIYNLEDDTREIPVPSFNEFCSIINKLKCSKAAGSVNISPELIKNGGRT
jgi:hypothetical protein